MNNYKSSRFLKFCITEAKIPKYIVSYAEGCVKTNNFFIRMFKFRGNKSYRIVLDKIKPSEINYYKIKWTVYD